MSRMSRQIRPLLWEPPDRPGAVRCRCQVRVAPDGCVSWTACWRHAWRRASTADVVALMGRARADNARADSE